MEKVIVIGGGAAGLLASGRAAEKGYEVHLYEKNEKLGKKIYITGKGRCNITNASDTSDIIENIPRNPYFMYSALYSFESSDVVSFFNSNGLPTKVERGNRVFPVSDSAKDVVSTLEKYIKKAGVKIHLNKEVKEILVKDNKVFGILLKSGEKIQCDKIILCTGGLSYPLTGSTGDGYKMAEKIGHTITKLYPCLVPLRIEERFCETLMGLSLKNVAINIKDEKNKTVYTDFGEMLFTHFGVSGPIILSASSHLIEKKDKFTIHLDLKPALDEKTLDKRILRDFKENINKDFKNALNDLLPQKIIPVIINLSGIDENKKVNEITKEERKNLISSIKDMKLTVLGPTGFNDAVITRGGISVDEINPHSMESNIVKGLYFAGEIIDVDGYTGGYNLQIAFSTGKLAGELYES